MEKQYLKDGKQNLDPGRQLIKISQGIVMKIQKMFQDRADKKNTVEKSNKLYEEMSTIQLRQLEYYCLIAAFSIK